MQVVALRLLQPHAFFVSTQHKPTGGSHGNVRSRKLLDPDAACFMLDCLMLDAWCLMLDARCLMPDAFLMVYGPWFKSHDAWLMAHGGSWPRKGERGAGPFLTRVSRDRPSPCPGFRAHFLTMDVKPLAFRATTHEPSSINIKHQASIIKK